jgi:hypothetical protein
MVFLVMTHGGLPASMVFQSWQKFSSFSGNAFDGFFGGNDRSRFDPIFLPKNGQNSSLPLGGFLGV